MAPSLADYMLTHADMHMLKTLVQLQKADGVFLPYTIWVGANTWILHRKLYGMKIDSQSFELTPCFVTLALAESRLH